MKKSFNKVCKFFALIFVLISIAFFISVLRINLLPEKYILILSIVEIVLVFSILLGLVIKQKTNIIKTICLIIAVFLCIIYLFAIHYINVTKGLLNSAFSKSNETRDYYIVVKNDSKYNLIEDITGEKIITFQIDDSIKKEVSDKVSVGFAEEEGLNKLGEKLLSNNVNVLLISSSQYDMLDDEIEEFKNNTKIIYTITQTLENKIDKIDTSYTIDKEIFNIYISGIDTAGDIGKVSRSDANMLLTINTKTHEVLLTSIPRDYYVTLHSKNAKDKLTHSGIYGINETISTIEDLLEIDINYYVRVNFTTLIRLVNILDGIDVYSDYEFDAGKYHFDKGLNHLDGKNALIFSRERHSFSDGDNQRVKNQQKVVEAIIKKASNSATVLTKYDDIIESLDGCFQSNIEQQQITALVKKQLNNMTSWKITNNVLAGTNASKTTYSMGNQLLYVMIPDDTSIEMAKEKINKIMEIK